MMRETVSVLISAAAIDDRLTELAAQIKEDYGDKPLTLVCALKGAVIFLADLSRKLDNNVEFDFLRVSSYGDESISNGAVALSHKTGSLKDRHVLLIEDIADTGHTLVFLRKHLMGMEPASLKICVLLDKPDRRQTPDAKFDYLGFSIPDVFIVGYGLDYAQRYRNLPFIGALSFEE